MNTAILYTDPANRPPYERVTFRDMQTCFCCLSPLTTDAELLDGVCASCADAPLGVTPTASAFAWMSDNACTFYDNDSKAIQYAHEAEETVPNCAYCEPGKPATTTVYNRAMQQELAVCTFCAETSKLHGCPERGGDPENPFSECRTCEATMQARNRGTRPSDSLPAYRQALAAKLADSLRDDRRD